MRLARFEVFFRKNFPFPGINPTDLKRNTAPLVIGRFLKSSESVLKVFKIGAKMPEISSEMPCLIHFPLKWQKSYMSHNALGSLSQEATLRPLALAKASPVGVRPGLLAHSKLRSWKLNTNLFFGVYCILYSILIKILKSSLSITLPSSITLTDNESFLPNQDLQFRQVQYHIFLRSLKHKC